MQAAPFDGDHPSPRYEALIDAYRFMHEHGAPQDGIAPEAMFPGQSLAEHAMTLWQLTKVRRFQTLLDYGCGKAMLYQPGHEMQSPDGRRAGCLQDLLGVEATLFDPGYRRYSEKPVGRFDLVVCTDVLEHCGEDDLPWIIDELFGFSREYVFANVACYPARKTLPNGENAHCTIRPAAWWERLFAERAGSHPGIDWQLVCTAFVAGVRENRHFGRDRLSTLPLAGANQA